MTLSNAPNGQLEGKVSWLLSLEWLNVGRGAIITGIHHHPVTRVNNISSIGICLHLRTIHQVVATILLKHDTVCLSNDYWGCNILSTMYFSTRAYTSLSMVFRTLHILFYWFFSVRYSNGSWLFYWLFLSFSDFSSTLVLTFPNFFRLFINFLLTLPF